MKVYEDVKNIKYSILMSIYIKEEPEYFRACMQSILEQTIQPEQIVIVKDGPLTEELNRVLEEYTKDADELYTIVPLETNVGLGLALAEGILHCRNELVARMDTDDIAVHDRIEIQLHEFQKNPALDICGGQILEFEGRPENVVAKRSVPLEYEDIVKYQKKRDAFNHMTVMYKKSTVIDAGNYQSCLLMEDSLLWVNMILSGAVCKNVENVLVYARVGSGMFERRGGLDYFKKYREGRRKIRQTGFISPFDYYYTVMAQFIVAMMPQKMRGFVYKKLLHA